MRRLLGQLRDEPDASSSVLAGWLRRAFEAHNENAALNLALAQALSGCTAQRRATLTRVLRSRDRCRLSDRSYYRARKEVVERLAGTISERLADTKSRPQKRAREARPIALPMVDRLAPERILPDHYRGPDLGRALSAAALSAEMSGEQELADALISEAGDNIRNQFDRRDVASAFEVVQNKFFIARCRGDLLAMRAGVRSMAPLYDRLTRAARVKFALDCSEVYLYEGRLHDAQSELDFALLNDSFREGTLLKSITLVRKAQIALARHDLKTAEEAAKTAAQSARTHADIRVYAAEVLGRSSLQSGSRWSTYGLEECQSVFHALSVRTLLARHRLQRGNLEAACTMAETSYKSALQLRYWNLASRSASTLAICSSSEDAADWLAEALRLHLISRQQNAYAGNDLFDTGPRSSELMRSFLHSDELVAVICEIYLRRFPHSLFEPGTDSLLWRLTRCVLRGTLDVQNMGSYDLFTPAAKRWLQQPIHLDEIEREVGRLGRLTCSLSILLPFEQRGNFVSANRRQTNCTLHALRRSLARHHWTLLRRTS
ncbi:MAG: hypothetical protein M3R51_00055 [Candidatus Eremiobacteraeota bacterium]|nr:hypothetical protein [Candidatus Eremiobacteraeota bacterium]